MKENNDNLIDSKKYTENILNSMINTVMVIGTDGYIKKVNTSLCTMLGYEEKELIGKPSIDIFSSISISELIDINHTTKADVTKEIVYRTKDGNRVPVSFTHSIMRDSNNNIEGIVCVAQNIKDRIEAEQQLAVTRSQLIESARKEGMSVIATGILHNLGNVLNSVNSSTEEITQIIKTSKVMSFMNANKLLREHTDNLSGFFSNNEKGRKLPGFYLKLGDVLLEENSRIGKSIKRVGDKISTMKGIIETQQEFAKAEGHSEQEDLPKVINDVLKIQKDLIESNGVHVAGDYEKPLRSKVHKFKLIQVLLNLVKNAVESMKGNDLLNKTRELKIETGEIDEKSDYLKVTDNGSGITVENLGKIFKHGFTTKETGHGFGLHASAASVAEMGGNISVESDGENQGASFVIKLPVQEEDAELA